MDLRGELVTLTQWTLGDASMARVP